MGGVAARGRGLAKFEGCGFGSNGFDYVSSWGIRVGLRVLKCFA